MSNTSNEISIKDLIFLFLGKLHFIIAAAIIGAGIAYTYSTYGITPQYQSNISLYVRNADHQYSQNVNAGDLTVSKSLVSTYIVILKNDIVMDKIGDKLLENHSVDELKQYFNVIDGKVSNGSLKSCFSMAAENQTEILNITATTSSAKLSQELCNIMADVAPGFIIRVVGAGSVEKIGSARLYEGKISPNIGKNTLVGGMAGAILVIAIVFLIDFFDNTVKEANSLQDRFQKPILGEIPHIGGKTKKKDFGKSVDRKSKLLFNNSDIPFSVVENYKSLRTNVMFSLSTAENRIIAATSTLPSDGKSVTIANLAVTMAEAEKKVLLIDADMRKPVQHKNFDLKNKKGLSTVLSKETDFKDSVHHNVTNNLDILTSGVIPPNPSELLSSKKMRDMIEEIKSQYDYILIDTPPILQMTDVIGLSDVVAGAMIVVSYGMTTYSELEEAEKKFELGNCNLAGFVLNNIEEKGRNGYGYNKYSYKYGYRRSYKYYDQNYRYEQTLENSDQDDAGADTDKSSEKSRKNKKDK